MCFIERTSSSPSTPLAHFGGRWCTEGANDGATHKALVGSYAFLLVPLHESHFAVYRRSSNDGEKFLFEGHGGTAGTPKPLGVSG